MDSPNIANIGQISIAAQDIDRATSFYKDVLKLQHLFTVPPGLSFFMAGEVRLMISKQENSDFAGTSTIYFRVPDINLAAANIKPRAEMIDEPHMIANMGDHELWMCFFKDSEGNTMAFMEERRI